MRASNSNNSSASVIKILNMTVLSGIGAAHSKRFSEENTTDEGFYLYSLSDESTANNSTLSTASEKTVLP